MEQIELFKEKDTTPPVSERKENKAKVKKPGSEYWEPKSHEEKDEYAQKIYGAKKALIKERADRAKEQAKKDWPK